VTIPEAFEDLIGKLRGLSGTRPATVRDHLVAALAAFVIVGSSSALLWLDPEPIPQRFWSLFLGDNTVYASGYSALAFRRVRTGMSMDEVRTLLGAPSRSWEPEFQRGATWWYSQPVPKGNFHQRIVLFGTDSKVESTWAEYYVD
jgi:hypothetical protein